VDTGTQEKTYQGKTEKYRSIQFSWELPNERHDGKPMMVSKNYRLSMSEKANFRKDLQSWRGKNYTQEELDDASENGFDFEKLMGKPALLTIMHSEGENVYANVTNVAPPMKGMEIPKKTENDHVTVLLIPGEFKKAMFDTLSEKMQEYIAKSPEYKAIVSGKPIEDNNHQTAMDLDDEIPF
jgi:hypothetical protein